jgi:hypothetical protein
MGEPLLAPALRLLEEGKDGEALALLQTPQEDLPEAERLALLGFAAGRKGDLRAYRALALKAARRAQTPLTLYHLGLALPPKAGALALEEALRRFRGDAKGEARLHLALAVALERLGRLEALAHAALARLKDPSPWTILHHLRLELFFGAKPLPEVLEEAEPFLPHPFPGVRLLAGHTLALAHLLRALGWEAPPLLADPRTALPAVALVANWKFLGFHYLIALAALRSLPREVLEAARVDGAAGLSLLRFVLLPLLGPVLLFLFLSAMASALEYAFVPVEVMTQGGPFGHTNHLMYAVYQEAFRFFRTGVAAAQATLLTLGLGALILGQLWLLERRAAHG